MSLFIKDLAVNINGKQLLDCVSEELNPGQILGVIGENGAGKSTLLNAILGVQRHTGQCKINDIDINAYSPTELAEIRAVLPQSTLLSFPLKVIEVVRLASSLASISIHDETRILWNSLEYFSVDHLADRDYRTLSGGEKQRVQLARVTAQLQCHAGNQPQYLLLDEPIAALDLNQQLATLRALKEVASKNVGVLMIIHDINLASLYCDRLLVLKSGKQIASGSPNETLTKSVMRKTFNVDLHVELHPDIARPTVIPLLTN